MADIYSFTNFGLSVDVVAPGVDVKSAYIGDPKKTAVLSGTSMAAPHIAGLGAYLLALEGEVTPKELCDRIRNLATKDQVSGLQGILTTSDLAFNGAKA